MSTHGWLRELFQETTSRKRPPLTQLCFPHFHDLFGDLVLTHDQQTLACRDPCAIVVTPEGDGLLSIELAPWGISVELRLPFNAKYKSDGEIHDHETSLLGTIFADPRCAHEELEDSDGEWRAPIYATKWRRYTHKLRVTPWTSADPPPDEKTLFAFPSLTQRDASGEQMVLSVVQWIAERQLIYSGCLQREVLATAAQLLREAAQLIPFLPEAGAKRQIVRFPSFSTMPWFIFDVLTSDSSGQMSRMVDICPGLFIFAKGLSDLGRSDHCRHLLDSIQKGIPLDQLLAIAVQLWLSSPPELLSTSRGPWIDLALDPKKKASLLELRIRHAGTLVSPQVLLAPFFPGFSPEEIPHDAIANRNWFEITTNQLQCPSQGEEKDKPHPLVVFRCLSGLGRFLSKHWPSLDNQVREREYGWKLFVQELFEVLVFTGQHLSRRTDPMSVYRTVREYHDSAMNVLANQIILQGPSSLDGAAAWVSDGSVIRPIATSEEGIRLSINLHHWTRWLLLSSIAGPARLQLYYAFIRGAPLIILLERQENVLKLSMAHGLCDQPATREEERVLRSWLNALNSV